MRTEEVVLQLENEEEGEGQEEEGHNQNGGEEQVNVTPAAKYLSIQVEHHNMNDNTFVVTESWIGRMRKALSV